jgi:4-amino-4-deoxy-L-arabinose transferase-like glycosyltransferase
LDGEVCGKDARTPGTRTFTAPHLTALMRDPLDQSPPPPSPARGWWREWEAAALAVLVLAVYFTRLTAAPVCGEESRWATGAREMIASGDWIVPCQQDMIFPERPPLGSWAMAVVGLARGDVDLVAVRLPSACATLLLTWLIYAYARAWMSRLGALASAASFATLGQVLVLGRFGETEAVFTLFAAGALMVWHWGYLAHWPAWLMWSAGYSLSALGALAKGPQAPVYFVTACGAYLIWRRQWRLLFGAGHFVGLACFGAIVGAWLVPFGTSNWHAIDDIWTGLAQDRFTTNGLVKHLATYPFETFACLLPWSPLLLGLTKSSVRRALAASRPQAGFLVVALVVTYPSVWLAAGARGRYFMPLYPCLAVLVGLVVEHCADRAACLDDRRVWRLFLRGAAIAAVVAAAVVVVASVLPIPRLDGARQPLSFLAVWATAALVSASILVWASIDERVARTQIAIITVCTFLGLTSAGALLNSRVNGGNDLTSAIAHIKEQMPLPESLVSLGRVYHRFAYCYHSPIRQIPWPLAAGEFPPNVTFFCFDRRPGDTDQMRSGSDNRIGMTTPGTLPFEWDTIAEIPCDPVKRSQHHRTVVVGRVRRGGELANPPISRPSLR